jgi:hypothetical protein
MMSLRVCEGGVTELTNIQQIVTVWLREHNVPEDAYAFINKPKH